jgi:autotransporter translocation and assembly factor TamB
VALSVAPAPGSAPVHGRLHANYNASTQTVDVGHSILNLPSSRAEVSGLFGREMRAHLETTDLNDLLPIFGQNAKTLPVKLNGGSATFDGTVTGKIATPRFDGRLVAKSFSVQGRPTDWLDAEVTASPETAQLRNATAARGTLRVRLDAQVALDDWEAGDGSLVHGNAKLENAPLNELLAVAGEPDFPASGIPGSAWLTGTVGRPLVAGDITVVKGTLRDEPFDRLSAALNYANETLTLTAGQIAAGPKRVDLTAAFKHAPGNWTPATSPSAAPPTSCPSPASLPPGGSARRQRDRPGQSRGRVGHRRQRPHDVAARRRRWPEPAPLRTAARRRPFHRRFRRSAPAHALEANANSAVKGDGSWRLEGDYPGSAT